MVNSKHFDVSNAKYNKHKEVAHSTNTMALITSFLYILCLSLKIYNSFYLWAVTLRLRPLRPGCWTCVHLSGIPAVDLSCVLRFSNMNYYAAPPGMPRFGDMNPAVDLSCVPRFGNMNYAAANTSMPRFCDMNPAVDLSCVLRFSNMNYYATPPGMPQFGDMNPAVDLSCVPWLSNMSYAAAPPGMPRFGDMNPTMSR